MIKILLSLFIGVFFLFTIKTTAFAIALPFPPSASESAGLDSGSNTNLVINSVLGFLKNLDSLSGGFVFATPDVFSSTVKLSDGTEIKGLSKIRNLFYILSVPVSAIIIFWFSGMGMVSNQMLFIKQLIGRIGVYVFLLLFLVPLLSFTIKAENLLTSSILSIPQTKESNITSFVSDYYTSAGEKISSGQATGESLAIPNPNFWDFMSSIVHVVTQLFFFIITLLALVLGMLFIIMQFILRFISLMFLSLIVPIVMPFVLSEKTEGIIKSYFKVWFTFLIHQPAFALGYVMVMILVRSMLESQGANVALLLLYTGSLFFLGTVNILASRIFADSWVALGASLEAGAFAAAGNRILGKTASFGWRNRDKIMDQLGKLKPTGFTEELNKRPPDVAYARPEVYTAEYSGKTLGRGTVAGGNEPIYGGSPADMTNTPPAGMSPKVTGRQSGQTGFSSTPQAKRNFTGTYMREMKRKGFTTEIINKEQGIVSAQGTGYSYYDKKNDLSYTYLSKKDALATGISEGEITERVLPKKNYVDLSQFRSGKNQFNASATKKAMSMGYDSDYAHVTRRSDAVTIKRHMEMNKEAFDNLGVNGVISRHFDNHRGRAARETTRIISPGRVK